MNRRYFLGASAAAGLAAGTSSAAEGGNQYIELRFYQLRNSDSKQRARFNDFLRNHHLPMTKRAGIAPAGYFQVYLGPRTPSIVTVTAYNSLSDIERVRADKQWGASLDSIAGAPLFDRAESWLLRAFDAAPKLEAPPIEEGKKPRFFDLRIYESESFRDNRLKVDMFNSAGEIAIFRRCGLNPLFFGEAIYGTQMPNLAYMVWYDDWAAREKAWAKFRKDPQWAKISKAPKWAGTVSHITNTFLQPLPFSPIR